MNGTQTGKISAETASHSSRLRSFLAASVVAITTSLIGTPAQATTLSIAGIRPDAEHYASWSARFRACGEFLHEGDGLALQGYSAVFNERVRLDAASQLGKRALTFDEMQAMAPQAMAQYSSELHQYLDTQRAFDLAHASEITQAGCNSMVQAFAAYYEPFKKRVERMRNGAVYLPSGQ